MATVSWKNQQKQNAIAWAKEVMADPLTVFLDTETTGIREAEIVQIAIVNREGEALLDTLVKPTIKKVEQGAEAVHGISMEILQHAPTWKELQPQLIPIVTTHRVITYNAEFDWSVARMTASYANMEGTYWQSFTGVWECAMIEFAAFFGEWNDYRESFKWQKLGLAHRVMMGKYIEAQHTALGDAKACRDVVAAMANYR